MKRTLGSPVLLGFALAFAVVLLNGAVSAWNTHTLHDNAAAVERSHQTLSTLDAALATLLDAETRQRGYLITGDESYLGAYRGAETTLPGLLDRLRDLRQERYRPERFSRFRTLIDQRLAELAEAVAARREGGPEAARTVVIDNRGKEAMDRIRDIAEEIRAEETRVLAGRAAESRSSYLTALVSGLGAVVLCLVMVGVAYLMVRRELGARQRAEAEVRRGRDGFERRVEERTHDLLESNRALERSNRELELFASVASHDLQEPLRKIQAFGDRLGQKFSDALGEQGKEYVARMQHAAARMRTLIDDLLAYARVNTRGKPFEPVDLNEVARQVVSDLEGRLGDTGGRVELGELPTVEADPTQMGQLLQNLIGNALKFRKPDVPPMIQVSSRVAQGNGSVTCEVVVRDNGIGFEPQYAERIFGLFQRLHGRSEYEGTGMGLAICRKIVERHRGGIAAVSVPGEGSTFTVRLPLSNPPTEGSTDEATG